MAQLNEQDRAELVAYLDGELDEETAQAFEARLSRDRKLRAEAEALKRTWEMLDYLPRAEASASFTHRTLERLAVQNSGRLARLTRSRHWAWIAPAGWAAALLIAVLAGLWAGRHFWPAGNGRQVNQQPELEALIVRDQEVIRNKRAYENIPDLEFARRLANELGGDDEE